MAESKPRVKVPKSASAGEVVTIKALISHVMESGVRKDGDGNVIPRQIINHFTATYNGATIVDAELFPSVSANPYFEFDAVINEAGTMEFKWVDDDGSEYTDSKDIEIA